MYRPQELKMIRETTKIFDSASVTSHGAPAPAVTATCVRVPVLRAHCESVNLTFRDPITHHSAREILASAPGIAIVDDREANAFPEPLAPPRNCKQADLPVYGYSVFASTAVLLSATL